MAAFDTVRWVVVVLCAIVFHRSVYVFHSVYTFAVLVYFPQDELNSVR